MNHRAELVRLIAEGTPPLAIVDFFLRSGMHPQALDAFLSESGIQIGRRKEFTDDISEERRLELQDLSIKP